MRDRLGQALYVGKAGDLRTRVRSYFGARRQPPRIEGALAALAAIDAAPTGSELEAALAELDLIRRWRPPATCATRGPTSPSTCGWRWPSTRRRSDCARRCATTAPSTRARSPRAGWRRRRPRRCATATGLRTCRPRLPVDDGRCLRGAAGRCLAHCRGGDDALAYVRSARALAAWLAGEEAVLDAPLRARVARLIEQQRFEDAGRTTRLLDALRAADAQVSSIRRASRRTGVLLASDLDPRHVVAFAVVRGALVAKRRLPRAGRPGARARRRRGSARAGARPGSGTRAARRGPLAAGGALLRRPCCSRRPSPAARRESWPIACTAPDALALKRVAAARRGVPAARAAATRPPSARRGSRGGGVSHGSSSRARITAARPAR